MPGLVPWLLHRMPCRPGQLRRFRDLSRNALLPWPHLTFVVRPRTFPIPSASLKILSSTAKSTTRCSSTCRTWSLPAAAGSFALLNLKTIPATANSQLQWSEKIDPAYPADLMREQVEGTVILYAVIRADGTVGDVRVL